MAGKYYMQKSLTTEPYDIEQEFIGLRISKITGINSKGQPMNIFTRKWSDSSTMDVYVPTTITYDFPEVEMTFLMTDAGNILFDLRDEHDRFINYIQGITYFFDYYRNRRVKLLMNSAYEPSAEMYGRPAGNNRVMGTIKFTKIEQNESI